MGESVYHKKIERDGDGDSDVYDVLHAFGVTCPATQHAIKKLLMPGLRHDKSTLEDLQEARWAISRAIELYGGADKPINKAVDKVVNVMKLRLATSGKTGWDDPDNFPTSGILEAMFDNMNRGQIADVMNFLVMVYIRGDAAQLSREASRRYGLVLEPNTTYHVGDDGVPRKIKAAIDTGPGDGA